MIKCRLLITCGGAKEQVIHHIGPPQWIAPTCAPSYVGVGLAPTLCMLGHECGVATYRRTRRSVADVATPLSLYPVWDLWAFIIFDKEEISMRISPLNRVIAKRAYRRYYLFLVVSFLFPFSHICGQKAAHCDDMSTSNKCNASYRTDLSLENLKGKVRATITKIYGPGYTDTSAQKLPYASTTTSYYDMNGYLTEEKSDSAGVKVFFEIKRKYNNNGKIESEVSYSPDSSQYQEAKFQYNSNGMRRSGQIRSKNPSGSYDTSVLKYNSLGQWIELVKPGVKEILTYDAYGNRVLIIDSFLTGHKPPEIESMKYDGNCRMIESRTGGKMSIAQSMTYQNGVMKQSIDTTCDPGTTTIMKYDDKDNIIEAKSQSGDEHSEKNFFKSFRDSLWIVSYQYKYDALGNWIERVSCAIDGTKFQREVRRIIYY